MKQGRGGGEQDDEKQAAQNKGSAKPEGKDIPMISV